MTPSSDRRVGKFSVPFMSKQSRNDWRYMTLKRKPRERKNARDRENV